MRWLSVLMALSVALAGAGCQALPTDPCVVRGNAEIDWVDFVKFDGITYIADLQAAPLPEHALGAQHGVVRCRLSGNVSDPKYRSKDGDAAFLESGTPVYRVKGYDHRFRLAAHNGSRILLFEADTNPKASIGADLLDLAGKVEFVSVGPREGGERRVISETDQVQELIKLVLSAPTLPPGHRGGEATSGGTVWTVTFHFRDGTATARPYWPDTGFFWAGSGLRLPDRFREILDP